MHLLQVVAQQAAQGGQELVNPSRGARRLNRDAKSGQISVLFILSYLERRMRDSETHQCIRREIVEDDLA